jgi:hypothetical protein
MRCWHHPTIAGQWVLQELVVSCWGGFVIQTVSRIDRHIKEGELVIFHKGLEMTGGSGLNHGEKAR